MQTKLSGALLLLTTLIVIISCNKQDWKLSGTSSLDNKVENVKKWFESTKVTNENNILLQSYSSLAKNATERVFARFNKINAAINWSEAHITKHDKNEFIIVPLNRKAKPFKNKAFDAGKVLVFYKDFDNSQRFTVVEIVGSKGNNLPSNLTDIVKKSFISYKYKSDTKAYVSPDAFILFYDENYRYQASFESEGRSIKPSKYQLVNQKERTATLAAIAVNSTMKKKVTCNYGCETYYLVGTLYDIQTGQILRVDILNQWNECSGDPYGEAAGAGQIDCISNCATVMADGSTASDDEYAGEPTSIDAFQKNVPKKWICHRGFPWILSSREAGVIRLVNPATNQWEWQSLTHVDIVKTGITIGGTVSPNAGLGTPSFAAGSPNVLIAAMDLDYDITYTPICDCLGGIIPSYTLNYQTHSPLWSANP